MSNGKYRSSMQELRAKRKIEDVPAEVCTELADRGVSVEEGKRYYLLFRMMREGGVMTAKQVSERYRYPPSTAYNALKELAGAGLVQSARLGTRGAPLGFKATGALPEGWTEDRLAELPDPYPVSVVRPMAEVVGEAADNALTRALAKEVRPTEQNIEGYRDALDQLKGVRISVGEIDDIIGETIDLVMERLRNVRVDCPLCGALVEHRGATGAACTRKKCVFHGGVDGGSFDMSLRLMESFAKVNGGS